MRLIAIRHGETQWNAEHRVQGHLDSALTQRGIRQSRAIAARLSRERFSVLYSSDLGRAMQTAAIISEVTGVPIAQEVGLRERNMGVFEGLTKSEMARQFPVEYSDYERIGHGYRIPRGESGQDRLDRSIRVLTEIADRHPREIVVAVTHGGFSWGSSSMRWVCRRARGGGFDLGTPPTIVRSTLTEPGVSRRGTKHST